MAFKEEEFRYCKDSSFCRRQRKFEGQDDRATYRLHNVHVVDNGVVAEMKNALNPDQPLKLRATIYKSGIFRIEIDEAASSKPRYRVKDVLVGDISQHSVKGELSVEGGFAKYRSGDHELSLQLDPLPFLARLTYKGEVLFVMNSRNLLKWEVRREKSSEGAMEDITGENDGLWEESFRAHQDSKPNGPESIGVDFDFMGAKHVYGLPERGSRLMLGNTRGEGAARDEPYRLYNLDVFEYEVTADRAHQPLYGAVPILLSHRPNFSSALFWLNAAETMVDVEDGLSMKRTHWFSESGVIDVFLLSSDTPKGVQMQYASLVGTQFMPPAFSLGYHQCRWNYKDDADVRMVDSKFDEHDIPYDVLWLDIEHTVGKRYLTWDKHLFPDPEGLQHDLASRGRKMVTIIDPHLKVDMGYSVYAEAKRLGFFCKNKDGGDFEGHCWPGTSSWLDYLNPEVRDYWASRFLPSNYVGSTEHLYTWNDMNEPSVFNGPEITMPKDLLHHGNVEHRDVHNLYGFYMTMATVAGHKLLRPGRRPFILSRAFFAGSQRYAAVWTGDNGARWDHLASATPMLLQLSLGGIHFCGADVGGFFGNPEPELLVRWYQAAAYTPFFRGHAHIDTQRREPWLFGDVVMGQIRAAIRSRYLVLPYLYTLFHEAHTRGLPIMRPLWMEFPSDEITTAMDDSFMLGDALLVKPVVSANIRSSNVYLPSEKDDIWYPFRSGQTPKEEGVFTSLWSRFRGQKGSVRGQQAGGKTISVDSGVEQGIPVFQRGGTIIPTRERARRSTSAMRADPYTLHVALNVKSEAAGSLYMDDGDSDEHAAGGFLLFSLKFQSGRLEFRKTEGSGFSLPHAPPSLERVIVYGMTRQPARVTLKRNDGSESDLEFIFDKESAILVVRKPNALMNEEWTISF